ncbi:hypothetical protein H257_15017 [Aphanomyces astaci]|uniref:Uncharacterized protein n=1 Tax=Aphanomyces astaci TaxID=112090 RepID=W4FRB2_APHAT|nr:hypothetical protein H257_15017 [Aphanomyces astaci]ETV69188.1 hypothetical protein H257_15017 [Aphanomyces astaci]|eukprot:XP_009841290.1 hypothetical protein H257_15017 [Aphanomyces astaci]
MNKVDILLGYIVSPDSDTSTLPTHWAHALQHWGQMTWLMTCSMTWLMNPPRNTLPSPPPAYTHAILWDADNDGDSEDPTCHETHGLGSGHKAFSAAPTHYTPNKSLHEGDDADHRADHRKQGLQGTNNYSNTDQTRPTTHHTLTKARQTEAAARTTPV